MLVRLASAFLRPVAGWCLVREASLESLSSEMTTDELTWFRSRLTAGLGAIPGPYVR